MNSRRKFTSEQKAQIVLTIIKKELQPVLNMELRKKEWAILAFSLVKKKFIGA